MSVLMRYGGNECSTLRLELYILETGPSPL